MSLPRVELYKKLGLLLFSTLLALFLCEGVIRFLGLPRVDRRVTMRHPIGNAKGHCYSPSPREDLPYDVRKAKDAAVVQKLFALSNKKLDELKSYTPLCIHYDIQKRQRGFEPKRKQFVTVVGDSFTFGEGLPYRKTPAGWLSHFYPRYNFKNLGWPGYDIRDVYQKVQKIVESNDGYSSKDILYFYNINDVIISPKMRERKSFLVNDLQNIRYANAGKLYKSKKGFFETNSRLVAWIKKRFIIRKEARNTVQFYKDLYFSKENKSAVQQTFRSIHALHRMSKERGLRFTVLLYPLLYKKGGKYPFQKVHEFMIWTCKKMKVRCVDLLPAFQRHNSLENLTMHRVDFHPNSKANRTVIQYLKKNHLLPFGKNKKTTP